MLQVWWLLTASSSASMQGATFWQEGRFPLGASGAATPLKPSCPSTLRV